MTEQCLEGVVDEAIADIAPLPDPAICTMGGACADQDATALIVKYMEMCQGGLIAACLFQDRSDACLIELNTRFYQDRSEMFGQLLERLDDYDITRLPQLLQRRISNQSRLMPDISCNGTAAAQYYQATPQIVCTTSQSSADRLALIMAHYALDKAGVPR